MILILFRKIKTKINNMRLKISLGHVGSDLHAFGFPYVTIPKNLKIGSRCTINQDVYIGSRCMVMIGDDVRISSKVIIETGALSTNTFLREHSCKPIVIENNVWLASGSIILPGVHIGNNSIVGAGSVVNKDVPENSLVAGNPAKVIRQLI